MATVVNNPSTGDSSSSAMSMVLGILLVLGVLFLLFYFMGGAFRSAAPAPASNTGGGGTDIRNEVTAPAPAENDGGGTNISVPEQIDVNVDDGQE